MTPDFLQQIRKDLIRDEGMRLKPYECTSGKLTIGVGRNIEDNGISEEEAMFMLNGDILNCEQDLNQFIPYYRKQPDNIKLALINMVFNMGISRLLLFKNMLRCLREGDYEQAADEALDSRWAKQVKSRAYRIANLIRKG